MGVRRHGHRYILQSLGVVSLFNPIAGKLKNIEEKLTPNAAKTEERREVEEQFAPGVYVTVVTPVVPTSTQPPGETSGQSEVADHCLRYHIWDEGGRWHTLRELEAASNGLSLCVMSFAPGPLVLMQISQIGTVPRLLVNGMAGPFGTTFTDPLARSHSLSAHTFKWVLLFGCCVVFLWITYR